MCKFPLVKQEKERQTHMLPLSPDPVSHLKASLGTYLENYTCLAGASASATNERNFLLSNYTVVTFC